MRFQEQKLIETDVPASCSSGNPIMMGIDEAGRGPVLGPMVYCAAYWAVESSGSCEAMGFDDSKVLSAASRKNLYDKINETAEIGYFIMHMFLFLSLRALLAGSREVFQPLRFRTKCSEKCEIWMKSHAMPPFRL